MSYQYYVNSREVSRERTIKAIGNYYNIEAREPDIAYAEAWAEYDHRHKGKPGWFINDEIEIRVI
jgi:hypothetical protein